jgi:hypothetical protein
VVAVVKIEREVRPDAVDEMVQGETLEAPRHAERAGPGGHATHIIGLRDQQETEQQDEDDVQPSQHEPFPELFQRETRNQEEE